MKGNYVCLGQPLHAFEQRDNIRQSVEDYRRKIKFKQVKFSIIVLAWQSEILVLRWLYVVDYGHFKSNVSSMLLITTNSVFLKLNLSLWLHM